ncbi:MAG: transcription termination factor Rho, partial [Dehalococcoidia bacterium]
TRREELLLKEDVLKQVWLLRRMVAMISNDSNNFVEGTERVLDWMRKSESNAQFLSSLNREM